MGRARRAKKESYGWAIVLVLVCVFVVGGTFYMLFDIKGKIIFSEMTFTPGGAIIPFEPNEIDIELGEKIDITKEMKILNNKQ